MDWHEITDDDVVTSVPLNGGGRSYLVNGEPLTWKRGDDWRDPTDEYEAKAFAAARDTSCPQEERDQTAAYYRDLAAKSRAHWSSETP